MQSISFDPSLLEKRMAKVEVDPRFKPRPDMVVKEKNTYFI